MQYTNLTLTDKNRFKTLRLEEKIALSLGVIKKTFNQFTVPDLAIAWTGGKDSTLMLWLIKRFYEKKNLSIPEIIFIDEGDVFPEIWKFVQKFSKDWRIEYSIAHNQDVSSKAKCIGDKIKVSDLNQRNQDELERLGFTGEYFSYEPESFIGNHLMKTVAANIWLKQKKKKALFVGVRWDESKARANDNFFRKISDPPHSRIEPILHFSEKDVWDTTHTYKIPCVRLYKEGFRSLGTRTTTQKTDHRPAWKQDFNKIKEREGRRQDKEKMMQRLRAFGYM